jgi:hypothetical protein
MPDGSQKPPSRRAGRTPTAPRPWPAPPTSVQPIPTHAPMRERMTPPRRSHGSRPRPSARLGWACGATDPGTPPRQLPSSSLLVRHRTPRAIPRRMQLEIPRIAGELEDPRRFAERHALRRRVRLHVGGEVGIELGAPLERPPRRRRGRRRWGRRLRATRRRRALDQASARRGHRPGRRPRAPRARGWRAAMAQGGEGSPCRSLRHEAGSVGVARELRVAVRAVCLRAHGNARRGTRARPPRRL